VARDATAGDDRAEGVEPWLLQPMVSLIRVGNDGSDFRRMYTLTFFLLPIKGPECGERKMREDPEIERMVNAGWGLASSPSNLPEFTVDGLLPEYLSRLAPPDPQREAIALHQDAPVTLREVVETIAFRVALRMAEGSSGRASRQVQREIGNEVVS